MHDQSENWHTSKILDEKASAGGLTFEFIAINFRRLCRWFHHFHLFHILYRNQDFEWMQF